ncbi:MAG: hypothetical protein D6820_06630, partial [Lentisphaerae bacterium]
MARLVTTNALTGEKVSHPQVQLVEMGRDQAHAGCDLGIFQDVARMLNAQNTRLDPVTGLISKATNAVGPYEFLDDRILAAADYFCRFMLGYDTPWIPTPSSIDAHGKILKVYPRIADNYRGRLRQMNYWDMIYYYLRKGVDIRQKAPFYYGAFTKRIINNDLDWLFIPKHVSGEAARIATTVQEPPVVEIEERATCFSANASVISEANCRFLRVIPTAQGTRLAFLSTATRDKTVGMRIRTTAPVQLELAGFKHPWIIPDTRGKWLCTTYTMQATEYWRDIVYVCVKGDPSTRIDIDQLIRRPRGMISPLRILSPVTANKLVVWRDAPIQLNFRVDTGRVPLQVSFYSTDKPSTATLDSYSGIFRWQPAATGTYAFHLNASCNDMITTRRIEIDVVNDRAAAVHKIEASCFRPETRYLQSTLDAFLKVKSLLGQRLRHSDNREFLSLLIRYQNVAAALTPLTPQLADGSMDFPAVVQACDIGDSIGVLTDGNDDTFSGDFRNGDFVFDFGPGFRVT